MISHLGSQLGVADGIALANQLKENKKITIAFTGDGATSQGDFHESLNVAAVWNLPVIFIIENNGYGLSTPSAEQFRCKQFIDKGIGYGMEAHQVDGNNILEVHQKISELKESMKWSQRPILLECITFRMRGHEEASGTKYVPQELFDEWVDKDPVTNFENFLYSEKLLTVESVNEIRASIKTEINEGLAQAYAEPEISSDTQTELADVYADFDYEEINPVSESKKMRMIDSIADAIELAMAKHHNLILMGQDIAEYGGVFKATDGLVTKYGKSRVRNTPLCEAAIVGSSLGLSINGFKAMMEMQFADFVTEGFNQIVNNLAKINWRWGQNADVVVRMPTGAGVAAGPFHSQSNEAWFSHIPGLKIAYPSNAYDAKGLLLTAFEDPNPVMVFEHKALYRSTTEQVPTGYYNLPFGQANLVNEGTDMSIITYGMGVHWATKLVEEEGLNIDVLDLRTLVPLDWESVFKSAKKTGRVIVLHEDTLFGGIGGELVAEISDQCFEYLDAPVKRVASIDTAVPFHPNLESNFLPIQRLEKAVKEILSY